MHYFIDFGVGLAALVGILIAISILSIEAIWNAIVIIGGLLFIAGCAIGFTGWAIYCVYQLGAFIVSLV